MGGGMETNKNRFIEEWGAARENLEHNFRWTRRNLALVGLFGIALPVFIYKGIVKEFARCAFPDPHRPHLNTHLLLYPYRHPTSITTTQS
ncbi:hypothetical protein Pint_14134 [Pistacia integerrima]|uniref:Uncharacterized protein n=1 Tax=Pistacia integerrima TaxID=434235 RepID=A0ACC0Y807_9ROSI|nr:hypothetical protein Pint_14134 [Pistacia integerrima]